MTVPSTSPPQLEPAWEVAKLFPPQGAWTVEDYLALPTNRLVEWVDGKVEVLPVPTEQHQFLAFFLCSALVSHIRAGAGGWSVMAPMRLRVASRFREPDVMYLSADNGSHRGQQFWTFANLAMEVVSPDDPHRDRVVKRQEYAQAGIPEYWIIDPVEESVLLLTLAESASDYQEIGVFRRGDRVASLQVEGFEIDVNRSFDEGNG